MSDPLSGDSAEVEEEGVKENPVIKYFKDFKVLKKTKREYWWLQVINMLDCIAYFAMFNIATVTLSRDFGFTDVGAGWVYAWFSGTTTIFLFFSGVMTDWLGIKRALYIAVLGLLLTRIGVVAVQYMDEPVRMNDETELSVLYDGAGLPFVDGQPDLQITARDGTSFEVDLSGSTTIGELLGRITEGSGGKIEASLAPGWTSLRLEDLTDGDGDLIVAATAANPDAAEKLELTTEGEDSSIFDGRRIIGDLNNVKVSEINRGAGLMGGSTLEITDRLGAKMTVGGLDQVNTVSELFVLLKREAEAQPAQIEISLNTPGNGIIVADKCKADDGSDLKEGDLIIGGDAAKALQILAEADDEAGGQMTGSSLVNNPLRSWLTWGLLVLMAPFMAMLITIFQAGNRRFTTTKSRGAGFNLWYLFMNVGAAGGGFLIDIIYLRLGLPHFHVFTFGIVTGILCLGVILFFMRDCSQLREEGEEPETEEEKEAERNKPKKGPVAIAIAVLSEPVFWRFTVLITLLLGVRAVFLYLGLLFPKYWYRVIGEDAQVGLMQAFNPVLVIIGLLLVIPALQKFNVYKMLVFGALITSISMFIPAIPQLGGIDIVTWTYITTGVFLLVLTVGELIWSPRLSEYTAAIAPEGQEGTYLGLSMVPYFLAKLVISYYSGAMLLRWCQEYPPGEPNLGERMEAGQIPFIDSPNMMWVVLGTAALIGTLFAILGKGWFTRGAQFDAEES